MPVGYQVKPTQRPSSQTQNKQNKTTRWFILSRTHRSENRPKALQSRAGIAPRARCQSLSAPPRSGRWLLSATHPVEYQPFFFGGGLSFMQLVGCQMGFETLLPVAQRFDSFPPEFSLPLVKERLHSAASLRAPCRSACAPCRPPESCRACCVISLLLSWTEFRDHSCGPFPIKLR